jgi:type II secretory pathway pseudopilin PulG
MQEHIDHAFVTPPRKGLAITSLVLGIVSIPTCGLLFAGGIAGIILGAVALNKAKTQPHQFSGRGLAIAGIITSSLSLLVAIPGIIAAIAIPNLLKSQQAARESAALADVMTIGRAQVLYSITKGQGRFTDLRTLGALGLIETTLASGEKGGYLFNSDQITVEGLPPMFDVTGKPIQPGTLGTGNRSFYCNETLVVYETEDGEPPSASYKDRVPKNGTPVE